MNTKIDYIVQHADGRDWYTVGFAWSNEDAARKFAMSFEEPEAIKCRIVKREFTEKITEVDSFVVPAYVQTADEFAEQVISDSDGCREIDWGGIERFSDAEQEQIRKQVNESIDSCDSCGIYFSNYSLSDTSEGLLCDSCEAENQACEEEDLEEE